MGDNTKIEWTDATWNPIRARRSADDKVGWHCEHVSEGCRNCYAEAMNRRLGTGLEFKPGYLARNDRQGAELFIDEKMLMQPLVWQRPRMIFVCSMTDLFADFVPDEWIDIIFGVMALAPHHTFQVLTKRPARMRAWVSQTRHRGPTAECLAELYVDHPTAAAIAPFTTERALSVADKGWPLPNVWLGVSAENQPAADERIPHLRATPAAVRFVSAEPLLGPINFKRIPSAEPLLDPLERGSPASWGRFSWGSALEPAEIAGMVGNCVGMIPALDWVIVGGESGPGARPMHPQWVRDIRDQCAAADVPFHFKQVGAWEVAVDRERDDPDWRLDYSNKFANRGPTRWLNAAGGSGFHGESFCVMRHVGKARAGRLLDGVEHNGMPQPATRSAA